MEEAVGKNWKDVLRDEIFKPLGMNSTTAYLSAANSDRLALPYVMAAVGCSSMAYGKTDENMHPAGGLVSTVTDLSKWLLVHLNGGRLEGRQVFPTDLISESHLQLSEQDRDFGEIHRHGWAMGWDLGMLDGDTLVHRFGSFGGFYSHLSFMPARGLGVVVLVNESKGGSLQAEMVASFAYGLLRGQPNLTETYDSLLSALQAQAAKVRERIALDAEKRSARSQALSLPPESYQGVFRNAELGTPTCA
jgi:CubicO group peptidase (beta-lactamase class C family)